LAKIVTNKKPNAPQQNSLLNENITSPEVRLIGADGSSLGIVSIKEAQKAAYEASLDLVMITEEATPPVCKILDYGKYKYEQQKKKTESKKKQKIIELKEIQIRPAIGENDLLIKCKAIRRFIEAENKVKLLLRFRGREMNRQELGYDIVKKVLDYSEEFAKVESPPKLEGSTIITILTKK
jgi:translation initiation factor IF-3